MSLIFKGTGDSSRFLNHAANQLGDDMRDISSKTRVTPAAGAGVYVTVGQSLVCNYNGTAYTAGSTVSNFNTFDGRFYACVDPLLGCGGNGTVDVASGVGNQAGRIADALIAAGEHTSVIVAPVGVGGTEMARWADVNDLFPRFRVCLLRLREHGREPTAILFELGQEDAGLGTSQAAWEASFSTFRSAVRALGCNAPIIVAKCTWRPSTSNTTIRAAQTAVVNSGLGVYAGPDIDTLTGANRISGSPHLSATGAAAAALLWRDAIQAVI